MNTINKILEYVVPKTLELNRVHISNELVKINYAAIFCQSDIEYKNLNDEASKNGKVIENTPTGPLFKFHNSVETVAGPLWLVKIRRPDPTRPQRGDADFTLNDYNSFKKKYLGNSEYFKLIERENFEMIELRDPGFDVLSYFSSIPLILKLGIVQ